MSPKQIIDSGKMHPRQWLAVAIMIGLNALDGFDVLSSAFAGPGIKQEWQLGPDGLGHRAGNGTYRHGRRIIVAWQHGG